MGPKYQGTAKLQYKPGQWRTVEVWSQGRSGTMSPTTYYFKYQGRWIPPIEYYSKWDIPLNDWLKIIYAGPVLADLVYHDNPLLRSVPKQDSFGGYYMPIPLKIFNKA